MSHIQINNVIIDQEHLPIRFDTNTLESVTGYLRDGSLFSTATIPWKTTHGYAETIDAIKHTLSSPNRFAIPPGHLRCVFTINNQTNDQITCFLNNAITEINRHLAGIPSSAYKKSPNQIPKNPIAGLHRTLPITVLPLLTLVEPNTVIRPDFTNTLDVLNAINDALAKSIDINGTRNSAVYQRIISTLVGHADPHLADPKLQDIAETEIKDAIKLKEILAHRHSSNQITNIKGSIYRFGDYDTLADAQQSGGDKSIGPFPDFNTFESAMVLASQTADKLHHESHKNEMRISITATLTSPHHSNYEITFPDTFFNQILPTIETVLRF